MTEPSKLGLAILISGRGTNMDALLQACEAPDYPAQPMIVISNRPEAAGLEKARARGVAAKSIDHKSFGDDRQAFEQALQSELEAHKVEIIALAGFMRVLTSWFVNRWKGRMINIHPSLLPKYPGLHTHKRALEAGDAVAGCTVHHVIEGVDQGEIIAQAELAIEPGDTTERLADRILPLENRLYPSALKTVCENLLAMRTDQGNVSGS